MEQRRRALHVGGGRRVREQCEHLVVVEPARTVDDGACSTSSPVPDAQSLARALRASAVAPSWTGQSTSGYGGRGAASISISGGGG